MKNNFKRLLIEVETQLIIAHNLEYLSKKELEPLILQQETIAKLSIA